MKAVKIRQFGGPEVMSYEDTEMPRIGRKDVLIKIHTAGINYIDTYQRSGLYQIPLPATLGLEATGIVEDVGMEVTRFSRGERVAYTSVLGAYAEYASVHQDKIVRLPNGVTFEQGCAAMLQGCTAHYLTQSTYVIREGNRVLIHAAAGGVGLILTQVAKMMGGYVIGTVSTEAKAELAKAAGADEVILYTEKDFEAEVKRITNGEGVNVVYDSVGLATFEKSINCLKRFGYMVLYGNASGPVTTFNPATLGAKGSLFLTRPTLFDYLAERSDLEWRAGDVFEWIEQGDVKLRLEHNFKLADIQAAHRALEGRQTTGKILLTP